MKSALVCVVLGLAVICAIGCGGGASRDDVVIQGTTWNGDGKVVETKEWRMYAEPRDANAQISINVIPPEDQRALNQVSAPAPKKSSWWGWGGGDDETVKVTTTVRE